DALVGAHPFLAPATWSGPDRVRVAHNLQEQLALVFRGISFRTQSGGVSPDDSVKVQWTDGPRAVDVLAFGARYEWSVPRHGLDRRGGRTAWHDAFGSVKLVYAERNYSDFAVQTALDLLVRRCGAAFAGQMPSVALWRRGGLAGQTVLLPELGEVSVGATIANTLEHMSPVRA
ncbi:MAG TPA: hypothetical protein VJ598_10915, partial [Albitalea sp.]|nr:hypothetical protein [Albitalea sp.]